MEDQPFFMKLFGPDLMSEEQKEKIEETAEQFERIVRQTNTKNIQTEPPTFFVAGTQMENLANVSPTTNYRKIPVRMGISVLSIEHGL
ncbi:unnamed protein product [Strongylus vulgaris]|uniref:Uncharacterized protein n=1 Tax=Strongylus vulgaris TaxID=40348 RepID=A0A3P7JKB1_STRVU|nr:unnamed protein product [Strongylus vulgaris]